MTGGNANTGEIYFDGVKQTRISKIDFSIEANADAVINVQFMVDSIELISTKQEITISDTIPYQKHLALDGDVSCFHNRD